MKKLITLVSFIVLLVSCSENEVNQELENINQSKIDQVLDNKTVSERKVAYSLLNKNEKFTLWNSKLEGIISSKSFNTKQIELINEFKLKLKPSHFIKDSDEQVYLKTVYVPKYLKRLKKEFAVKQIGFIFYTVSRDDLTHVDNEGGGGGGDPTCDCNQNSMFSCSWLNASSCKNKTCESPVIEHQCGFLGMYPCNGLCKKV